MSDPGTDLQTVRSALHLAAIVAGKLDVPVSTVLAGAVADATLALDRLAASTAGISDASETGSVAGQEDTA